MLPQTPFQFGIALFAENGESLGVYAVQRDWEPVCQWTRFHFQRRGELPLAGKWGASVHPLWEESAGQPCCRGYRVQIVQQGGTTVHAEFPKTHFREDARLLAAKLVEQGQLQAGSRFTYVVTASAQPCEPPRAGGLRIADSSPRTPAEPASLDLYLARSAGQGITQRSDVPVFVAPRVLEEAAEQTHACEGIETGGVLIGSLWQDRAASEIFVEITAQIPAEYTAGSNVKLTFTPQTWTAAGAALRLRGRGEIHLGYWHSHPVREWCKSRACTPEAQKVCQFARDFFSADDESVMRAAFPSAYSVALVANDTAFTNLTFSMFGNREGFTRPRGYYLLQES